MNKLDGVLITLIICATIVLVNLIGKIPEKKEKDDENINENNQH
jgi:preprotein translocase subunit SecG